MIALVLAPLVALAPPPPAPGCGPPRTVATAQTDQLKVRKLGDLPDAEMDLAVIRSVGGCWVRQVVRFHVSDPQSQPSVQVPGFRGILVPDGPAGVEKVQPAR